MSKKDKLLADAQKLLQKGQTDKAVSCYQSAVALEPGDLRVRQRLAELLAKSYRLEEARKEFDVIGKNLTSNGFYLKAIAVYKQVERLFPDDISIALTLASLNEKHGLAAAAMAEYKRAFDYYEKQGNSVEALKALDAMQRIDARNPNVKLKYAEVLFQNGKTDEALEAFFTLGLLLVDRRDDVAFGRLAARIAQLFPQKPDFACSVLEQKIHDGSAESAAAVLQSIVRVYPQRYAEWRLLIVAYQNLDNPDRLKKICQHCIKQFPDEPFSREVMVTCLLEASDAQSALSLLDESEQLLIAKGAAGTLRDFYFRLNDLVPLNVRILKGCVRACDAAGDKDGAVAYAAKIGSLAGLGAQQPAVDSTVVESSPFEGIVSEEPAWPVIDQPEPEVAAAEAGPRELDLSHFIEPTSTAVEADDSFYEIEVELDDDGAAVDPEPADTWFETVNDIFDTIKTRSGKVRYGDGVDNGDARSQYDLGMALYEMGLYDEAINSFRQAAESADLQISCLILQGACLREMGELALAESALRTLLSSPKLSVEDTCALKYELALTLSARGEGGSARELFEEVRQLNPDYRELDRHLNDATDPGKESGFDFDEDDLLDFELK